MISTFELIEANTKTPLVSAIEEENREQADEQLLQLIREQHLESRLRSKID